MAGREIQGGQKVKGATAKEVEFERVAAETEEVFICARWCVGCQGGQKARVVCKEACVVCVIQKRVVCSCALLKEEPSPPPSAGCFPPPFTPQTRSCSPSPHRDFSVGLSPGRRGAKRLATASDDAQWEGGDGRGEGRLFAHVTPRPPLRKAASQNGGGGLRSSVRQRPPTPYAHGGGRHRQPRREVRFSEEVWELPADGSGRPVRRQRPGRMRAAEAEEEEPDGELSGEAPRAAPYSLRSAQRNPPSPFRMKESAEEASSSEGKEGFSSRGSSTTAP